MNKHWVSLAFAGVLLTAGFGASAADAPKPLEGNAGKYMSPFTSDGVTAGWVTKAMSVKAGGQIGSLAGNYAGQKAAEQMAAQIPFAGMFAKQLGQKAGQSAGRAIALKAIGGEEYLKASSDLSFNDLQAMSVYMYMNYGTTAEYDKILAAAKSIYPELDGVYASAIAGIQ